MWKATSAHSKQLVFPGKELVHMSGVQASAPAIQGMLSLIAWLWWPVGPAFVSLVGL